MNKGDAFDRLWIKHDYCMMGYDYPTNQSQPDEGEDWKIIVL